MEMSTFRTPAVCTVLLTVLAAPAFAGGAWVVPKGDADLQLGWSRKTATVSWDAFGNTLDHNGHSHDFRYTYLNGEFGITERLSGSFLVTWLDGREGRPGDVEANSGFSDAWLGAKYSLRRGRTPMALGLVLRTPILYDIDGPYERHLTDEDGNPITESPEWRGLNKHDLALVYYLSRSLEQGRGWTSAMVGYNWREGAPADEVPVAAEIGWKLPWYGMALKGSTFWSFSMKNDSRPEPDDRFDFGGRTDYNFNYASMGRVGLSVIVPLGLADDLHLEAGYNRWIWGESARKYSEPFFALGYRF